jgi:hypothetical protein
MAKTALEHLPQHVVEYMSKNLAETGPLSRANHDLS